MRSVLAIALLLVTVVSLSLSESVHAGALNSAADCVVGERVETRDGHKGKITRVDRDWSYCYVLQDDTGKEVGYLYSLLKTEGAGRGKTTSNKLVTGKYNCLVRDQASGELSITGASSYEVEGQKGTYRLEPSGKIVFESGPFSRYHAELISEGRIGLNDTGDSFYNMTCEPPR